MRQKKCLTYRNCNTRQDEKEFDERHFKLKKGDVINGQQLIKQGWQDVLDRGPNFKKK